MSTISKKLVINVLGLAVKIHFMHIYLADGTASMDAIEMADALLDSVENVEDLARLVEEVLTDLTMPR